MENNCDSILFLMAQNLYFNPFFIRHGFFIENPKIKILKIYGLQIFNLCIKIQMRMMMSLHLSCILLIYLIVGAKKYANINIQTNVSSIPNTVSTFSKNTQMFLDKMLKSIPKAEMPFPYHLHHHHPIFLKIDILQKLVLHTLSQFNL